MKKKYSKPTITKLSIQELENQPQCRWCEETDGFCDCLDSLLDWIRTQPEKQINLFPGIWIYMINESQGVFNEKGKELKVDLIDRHILNVIANRTFPGEPYCRDKNPKIAAFLGLSIKCIEKHVSKLIKLGLLEKPHGKGTLGIRLLSEGEMRGNGIQFNAQHVVNGSARRLSQEKFLRQTPSSQRV